MGRFMHVSGLVIATAALATVAFASGASAGVPIATRSRSSRR